MALPTRSPGQSPIDSAAINTITSLLQSGAAGTFLEGNGLGADPSFGSLPGSITSPVANLLVNPGNEIVAQAGPVSTNNLYIAGQEQLTITGTDTLSVNYDTTHNDTQGLQCLACTFVLGSGAGATGIQQKIEGYADYRGQTIALSRRVSCGVANKTRIGIFDSVNGWRFSAFNVGSSHTYETLAMTAPIAAAATSVFVGIFFAASDTVYLDNSMLIVGSTAIGYVPLSRADDQNRCLRYYESLALTTGHYVATAQVISTTSGIFSLPLQVKKAVAAPTVTITNVGSFECLNAGGSAAEVFTTFTAAVSDRNISCTFVVASGLVAGSAAVVRTNNGNATIVVEAHP